jgi:hypothetical protein
MTSPRRSVGTPGEARTVRSVAILSDELGREWITAVDFSNRWICAREYAAAKLRAAYLIGFLRRSYAQDVGLGQDGFDFSRYAYALATFVSEALALGQKFEDAARQLSESVTHAAENFERYRNDLKTETP